MKEEEASWDRERRKGRGRNEGVRREVRRRERGGKEGGKEGRSKGILRGRERSEGKCISGFKNLLKRIGCERDKPRRFDGDNCICEQIEEKQKNDDSMMDKDSR